MDRRIGYVTIGLILSIASKWLQFQYGSVWGDVLILFAALFFVLAILLSIPQYQSFLKNSKHHRSARLLAVYVCAAVLSFQLFTLFTFGQGMKWGLVFLIPVLSFAGLSFVQWRALPQATEK